MAEQKDTTGGAGQQDTVVAGTATDTVVVLGEDSVGTNDTVAGAKVSDVVVSKTEAPTKAVETPKVTSPAVVAKPTVKEEKKEEKKETKPEVAVAEPGDDTAEAFVLRKYKLADAAAIPRSVSTAIIKMDQYLSRMGPTVANSMAEGGAAQRDLYYTIVNALSAPDGEVNMVLETILYYFNRDRKDVFSPRMAYRFIAETKLGKEDTEALQSLIHIFITTCNPQGRMKALESIDMDRATAPIQNIRQRERLLSFYIHR